MPAGRRIALACLNPPVDGSGPPVQMPNYGLRRIHAAVVAHPELQDAVVHVVERSDKDIDAYVAELEAFEPDMVGFGAYVWSFPTFFEVARRLKARRPERTIVFGGPSARPAMFDLEPFRDGAHFIDVLVVNEGEEVFPELVALADRSASQLARIPGLATPSREGWKLQRRPTISNLDAIASPFQLGLVARDTIAYLETYRGCPMSCTFCEWGVAEWSGVDRVFSEDYLARELEAFAAAGSRSVFMLDAGLNLNARAFRNLRAADARVRYFKDAEVICEVYPSHVNDDILEFLAECRLSYLGVGLQSFNKEVLDTLERPFNMARFEQVVRDLSRISSSIELQIIMGLPGDSPEGFRETLARARALPCHVRVYHCLVLPDALLTRGSPDFAMQFDPHYLHLRSCRGWSEEQLRETAAWLTEEARRTGGGAGEYWWSLPSAVQFRQTQRVEQDKLAWLEQHRARRAATQVSENATPRVRLPRVP